MPPPDDDDTIRLTSPLSPTARPRLDVPLRSTTEAPPGRRGAGEPSRRLPTTAKPPGRQGVPLWTFGAAILLVVLGVAAGRLLWPAAPAPTAAVASAPAAAPKSPSPAGNGTSAGIAAAPATSVTPQAVAAVSPSATTSPAAGGSGTAAPAEFNFQTATEQQIVDHVPVAGAPDPTVFRFAQNPRILVLDFASLLDQGRTLNRVAALVEKSGLPHDRVLNNFELTAAIRASGDTVETFYYGHDYDSAAVIRFFALADRDNIRLVAEEDRLGRLIRQAGWFEPGARAALISIPQVGADANVTPSARATILHHELSHGEYFTDPAYAAFVHQFWTRMLSSGERDRIRAHLQSVGYDPGLEEVMENEAQAYLIFTDSAEFFTPAMIGMNTVRLAELRNEFWRAMPVGWLRDSLSRTLGASQAATDRH